MAKINILSLVALLLSTGTAFGQCSDLFFSEYLEGSSSNKSIEIYNPTPNPIDLADYEVHRFNNGGTTTPDILDLQGIIPAYGVFTAVNPSADPALLAIADTLDDITFYNGDDALLLINAAIGDTIDAIGRFGEDPGASWTVGTGATANFTLVRMAGIGGGTKDWTVGATQWDVLPNDDFSNAGFHNSNCAVTVVGCDGLFFSEYIEGTGNNKALEIYNASSSMIDLSLYQVHRHNNGTINAADTFKLAGMLAPYDVYVIGNASGAAAILAVSDTTGSATFYNGDDALLLINTATGDTADVIGKLGEDPGTNWPVGTGATSEFTLVRMASVTEGTTDWTIGATQWEVFPQNTFTELGAHTNTCAPPVLDAEVNFVLAAGSASEGSGTAPVSIDLLNPSSDTVAVQVMLSSASTATLGADFAFTDTTIVFAGGSAGPINLSITILEDAVVESDETVVLTLKNATNGALIGADSVFTFTITDNDFNVYPIGLVTADADGDGLADSLNVNCELRGVVYGVNLSTTGLQFYLRDNTDGIQVFSGSVVSGYVVNQGDSLHVTGRIDHFNGLAEIIPTSVTLISSGNALAAPVVVTAFDETTENEYIQLNCVWLLDSALWPADGANANVNFTNGVDTFLVRIDKETEIDGSPAPMGYLNVRGLGAQFDGSAPYTSGYQLFPMFLTDLQPLAAETADLSVTSEDTDESAGTFSFQVLVANANPDSTVLTLEVDPSSTATEGTDFSVSFSYTLQGCGDSDTLDVVVTITDDSDVEGDETVVLNLVSSEAATVITQGTLTLTITETDNVRDLLPISSVRAYPNPGSELVRLESDLRMERVTLLNLHGQVVLASDEAGNQVELRTAAIAAGVYLLRVETAEGIWMQRWIRE